MEEPRKEARMERDRLGSIPTIELETTDGATTSLIGVGILEPLSIIQTPEDNDIAKKRFANYGEYSEWRIRAKLGIYPSDHPLSTYAQQLMDRVGGTPDKEKPRITVFKGEPNAFVFPNGSTYISDQLIDFAENEEEILFAMMHERIHHQEAHSEKVFERAQDADREYSDLIFGGLAQLRIHEWGGDIKALEELDRLGINPMGGVSLMEKFRKDEKLGGGAVHGKSTDRSLNLRAVTYGKDLQSIERPFHPIPIEIKAEINSEKNDGLYDSYHDQLIENIKSYHHSKSLEVIDRMGLDQLLATLPDLIKMHDTNLRFSEHSRDRYAQSAVFQKKFISVVAKKIWEKLASSEVVTETKISTQQNTLLYHTLLFTLSGLDRKSDQSLLFDPNLKVREIDGQEIVWSEGNFSFAEQILELDDIQRLLEIWDPNIYKGLGLKLINEPTKLITLIVDRAMDNFIFEPENSDFKTEDFFQFVQSLENRVKALYREHGAVEYDEGNLFRGIIDHVGEYLGKEDKEIVLAKAKELNPEAFDPQKITAEQKKAQEQESDDKLVKLFQDFVKEYNKNWEKVKSTWKFTGYNGKEQMPDSPIWNNSSFDKVLNDIFLEKQLQNPDDILIFLANFRNTIKDDDVLWTAHNNIEHLWDQLITDVLKKLPIAKSLTNPLDKKLFDFKVALINAHDDTADFLNNFPDFAYFYEDKGFNLSWFKEFYELATDENKLGKQLKVNTKTPMVLGTAFDRDWQEIFKRAKLEVLLQAVATLPKEEISRILELLTNNYPFNHYGSGKEKIEGETKEEVIVSEERKRKFLSDIFSKFQFDLSNLQDLKDLYYISTYLEDNSLAVRIQNVVWERLSSSFSFEEGFSFLEQELNARRLLSLKAVSDFIEKNAKTHDQIEQVGKRLTELLTKDSSLESIGKLIVTEQLVAKFFLDNKLETLLASIGNGEDDSYLKRFLYRKWTACINYERAATLDRIHLQDMMLKLYRLDAQSKYVFIRDLLTGENGVLTDKDIEKRVRFINFFLDNYVEVTDVSEEKFLKVIREVMEQVVRTANYDVLYFALAPILQEKVLLTPQSSTSWLDIIRTEEPPHGYQDLEEEVDEDTEKEDDDDEEDEVVYRKIPKDYYDLDENGELWGEKVARENAERQRVANSQIPINNTLNFTPRYLTSRVDENEVNTLYGYITGSQSKVNQESEQLRRNYEGQIEELLRGAEVIPAKPKMSVNEFLLETAQKLGAPGVRFLQLIGQYIELPPHLEAAFNEVYDKVGGQSKMTADQTLLREWPRARTTLTGLNDRLGGGSLMTVFKTETDLGQDLAVKVLNPNAGYHTDTTNELLSEVFGILAQRNPTFSPAPTLLADIREWIRNDIDFTGFLEQDQKFRQRHDGFSAGGRYRISVPHSYFPENKFFALEDFVEGTNLTQLERLQEQGHDTKQVVSLLTKSFFEQIRDGLVHSDIHPGNIRVTPDDRVAYLDRNYYLQFSIPERIFLGNLSSSLGDSRRATEVSLGYLANNGVTIDQDTRTRVFQQAEGLSTITDPTERLMRLAVTLRKEGLRFPIKTTLLIKDFFYLDRMAKRVGFSGIAEAYKVL